MLVRRCAAVNVRLRARIIHAGTGIPELTIDQWTNQKILEYHRHATDMIHGKKNDK